MNEPLVCRNCTADSSAGGGRLHDAALLGPRGQMLSPLFMFVPKINMGKKKNNNPTLVSLQRGARLRCCGSIIFGQEK